MDDIKLNAEPSDYIYNLDNDEMIYSGGFSVKSIMMKAGMSPIMTLNTSQFGGNKNDNVSDLFDNLVIPSWVLTYNNILSGKNEENNHKNDNNEEEEDDVIDDDLHDKLLNLVKETKETKETKEMKKSKKNTRILNKKTKKNITKKHKKQI